MLRLPELQHEFFRAITRSHDAAARSGSSPALIAEIRGDGRLGAADRLEVYARMYCARLVDVLGEDYPQVAAMLGADAFADVAHEYVTAHPSTHPSLRWFGRGFADFLAATTEHVLPAYLADLARLEWTRLAVFDAPDTGLLDLDTLRNLPPDGWASLHLRLVPALEVLQVAWPVHRIWEAGDSGSPATEWQSDEIWLRVWRQGDKVYQASMDVAERVALAHIQAGDEFAVWCEALATVVPANVAAETAGALVLRWIEDGVLAWMPFD
jgi:hypothetical protein